MDSFNYWQGRVKNEMLQRQLEEKVLAVEYETMVNYYRSQIEQLIDNFFTRYALGAKVSKAEAKKLVNAFDVEGFAGKAKRYVKEKNFSPRANEELALYNLTMKVNRLELLKANMELELIAMADEEVKMTEQKLKDEYVNQNLKQAELINRYRKQAGILEETVPEPQTLEKMAKAVINTPFKGATWSERIWKRQDALADVVGKLTQDAIFIGHSGDWIKTRLRKEFDVTAYEARRLAVTELARVQTAVQKESYERNDFEKYIYIAEPTACDICAELDGKTFLVKDMTPGKNACPMHPHCKCSSAPDVSDERAELDRLLDEWNDDTMKVNEDEEFIEFSTPEEVNEFFKNDIKAILNADEKTRSEINNYTYTGYSFLNDVLRNRQDYLDSSGNVKKNMVYAVENADRNHQILDSFIEDRILDDNITVYRGGVGRRFIEEQVGDLEDSIGQVYSDKGYQSTSPFIDVAEGFMCDRDIEVIIKYRVPKGKGRGAYINEVSDFKDREYEYLLKSDTKAVVKGFEKKGDINVVIMEVLDND